LMERLGSYCSYCERQIETHLAVEHIKPKDLNPTLALTWENFLLACSNCNSCKGDSPINLSGYLWPDRDNTLRAFTYRSGLVEIDQTLDPPTRLLAEALYLLVGLDKDPGNPNARRKPTSADKRWRTRERTWDLAQQSLVDLRQPGADTPQMRNQIARTAATRGGFGIWFKVFEADADMRQRLIAAFPGAATDCFDGTLEACQRPGGNL
jgi:hypothetical protein